LVQKRRGSGLARRCEVQIAYATAWPRPVSIHVETIGTGAVPDERCRRGTKVFDSPGGNYRDLDLRRPIYRSSAATATWAG
jgi:S-adenosylmethionine synthetase